MKKNRLSRAGITVILAAALVVSSLALASAGPQAEAAAASKYISWSKAKSVFLNEFPTLSGVKYLRLTTDDGRKIYAGKAVKGSYVYSIEIDATTGKVLDSDRDYEGSRYTASKVGAVSRTTIQNKIRKKVPGATIIYIRLTRDDGRYVYEAEAYKNGYEYDFEYSKGGTLLEYEKDKV
ncbi:MAG: PepSY domain-containing protein [Emergencia sp.]